MSWDPIENEKSTNIKKLPSYNSTKFELFFFYIYYVVVGIGVGVLNFYFINPTNILLYILIGYIVSGNLLFMHLEQKYDFVFNQLLNFVFDSKKYKKVQNKIMSFMLVILGLYVYTIYNIFQYWDSPVTTIGLYLAGFIILLSVISNLLIHNHLIHKYNKYQNRG